MNVIKGLLKVSPITVVTVFSIRATNGLYFRWCYVDGARAEKIARKLYANEKEFNLVNWTPDPEQCCLSQQERNKINEEKHARLLITPTTM